MANQQPCMDRNEYSIRTLTTVELYLVREIAQQTWPISYANMISKEQINYMLTWMYNDKSLLHQMEVEQATFILLSCGSEKIGFASCGPTENPLIYKLHKLYVLPRFQRAHAGSELLSHCIRFTRHNGAKTLLLQVNRNNSAVGFYLKHGFMIESEAKFDIGQGYFMDDYIMKIQLTEPD